VSAPGWAGRFPRIFELYAASAQGEPGNYFEFKNVRRGLAAGEPFFVRLEQILAALDPIAWQTFKIRTVPYVHKLDAWEYSKQLFERLHEAEGYLALKEKGYQHVRFLPEDTGTPQPDLEATDRGLLVLMEVKTVNESDDQKRYFETPLIHAMPCSSVEIPPRASKRSYARRLRGLTINSMPCRILQSSAGYYSCSLGSTFTSKLLDISPTSCGFRNHRASRSGGDC
jgi:hypothetical protein